LNTESLMNKPRIFLNWLLFRGFSGESLGIIRLYFGIGLIFYHHVQFKALIKLDPYGESFHYIERIWFFDLLGIERHIPWLTLPVYCLLLISTLLFAFGKWTKSAIITTILCIFYLKGCRDSFSGDVHHRYVIPVSLLIVFFVSKCAAAWSMDAGKKPKEELAEWEASWPIRTGQILIALYYFWALSAKHRLSGIEWFEYGGKIFEHLIKRSMRYGPDGSYLPLATQLIEYINIAFFFGLLVAIFEFFAPLVIVWRALWVRVIFVLSASSFHFGNYLLMNVKFYLFPLFFVFFFDPVAVHKKVLEKLGDSKRRLIIISFLAVLFVITLGRVYEQFS